MHYGTRNGAVGSGEKYLTAETTALQLVPGLYDAAANPERLTGVLSTLERSLGGYAVGLALRFPGSGRAPLIYSSDSVRSAQGSFEEHYYDIDPLSSYMLTAPLAIGEVIETEDRFPRADVIRGEFYTDFMRPNQMDWGPNYAMVLARDAGRVTATCTIARNVDVRALGEEQRTLVTLLAPHLVALHRLWSQFDQVTRPEARLADALDRIPLAVFVVDACRRVLWASRTAREILNVRDGLRVDDGELRAYAFRSSQVLGRQIGEAARTGSGGGLHAGGVLHVPRPSGRRAFEVLVTPLPRQTSLSTFELEGAAAVFVTDPEAQPPEAGELLAALYSLTPAESALATLLSADVPLADAADRLGITVGTARQRLKLIFEKTGTRRQSSLVRLLLRGPASFGSANASSGSSPS